MQVTKSNLNPSAFEGQDFLYEENDKERIRLGG